MKKTEGAKRSRRGISMGNILLYSVLILLCIVFLYPMWQALVCSVSAPGAVAAKNGALLLPKEPQIEVYKLLFHNKYFWNSTKNSIFYVALGTFLQYIVTVMAAYALNVPGLRHKRAIILYFVITMFFSGGMIPQYLLVNKLKLTNSVWALILPSAVNVWSIIVMKTQFAGIPQELRYAAQIDGAGEFRILFKVYLPLSRAASLVIVLFTAVAFWNMWFEPLLYMTDRSSYPLQSVLREILIENSTSIQSSGTNARNILLSGSDRAAVGRLIKYACIIISSAPVLIAFPFLQKFFSDGVLIGSLDD